MFNLSAAQTLRYSLLALVYVVTYKLLWHLSGSFETVPNLVSWYLPKGLMLFTYLVTPYRAWPFLYLGNLIGTSLFIDQNGQEGEPTLFSDSPYAYMGYQLLLPLANLLLIWLYRRENPSPFFASVKSAWQLLGLAMLLSLTASVGLWLRSWFEGGGKAEAFTDVMFLFMLGDLTGIAALLPMLLVCRQLLLAPQPHQLKDVVLCALGWALLLVVFAVATEAITALDYYLKVMTIVPALFFSYRFGWMGASLSVFAICLLAYFSAYITQGPTLENQFYIIAVSISCLFLGAAVTELRGLNAKMHRINNRVQQQNLTLAESLKTTKALSQRLIGVQEDERKRLSRDLHDDFGQRIVELRLNVNLLKQPAALLHEGLERIDAKLEQLYHSMKTSIGKLRPSGIAEHALEKSISSGELKALCRAAGVALNIEVVGTPLSLDEHTKLNAYRIAQEAINNCLKHAKATQIQLLIHYTQTMFCLCIDDNGQGFDTTSNKQGFGLSSMQERALSMDAVLEITADHQGTQVVLKKLLQGR